MGKSRPRSFAYAQDNSMEAMRLNNCHSEPSPLLRIDSARNLAFEFGDSVRLRSQEVG
jgi:hypothetical protein